jgi:hypothetical protein
MQTMQRSLEELRTAGIISAEEAGRFVVDYKQIKDF